MCSSDLVPHGEAVAIGMVYEGRLAETLGIAQAGTAQRIRQALEQLNLPVERPDASQIDELIEAMRTDKKVRAREIRLALPAAIGTAHGSDAQGWTVPVEEATREKFAEMRYLEKSIGRTGVLAIKPMLGMSHKDLWQLYMLGQ